MLMFLALSRMLPGLNRSSLASYNLFSGSGATELTCNQSPSGVAEFLDSHQQLQEPTVLLDTGIDSLVFPFEHFREWAMTYQILIGWNVAPITDRAGVEAQMLLVVPGRRSPGWRCDIEPE